MNDGWCPFALRLEITTNEYFTAREVLLEDIVDHITDGTDSRDHLQNANNQSSVHFLIRMEDGRAVIYQFMPVHWAAWGNGRYSKNNPFMPAWAKDLIARDININHATVSIEHERKWPFTTPPPAPMVEASIRLHKWLADTYPTIKRDREHIIGHYQIDHISRANCPGGPGGALFPFDTIIAALNAPAPVPSVVVNGHTIRGGFLGLWNKHGLEIMGLPLSEEYTQVVPALGNTVVTFQDFENVIVEWFPGSQARIGAGVRRLKYE